MERYQAIKEFVSETFWKISLKHKRDDVVVDFVWDRQRLFDRDVVQVTFFSTFQVSELMLLYFLQYAKWMFRCIFLFDMNARFQVLLDDCEEAGEARVLSVIRKPKSKWRPAALDTVELEKLAVRKLKLSAKEAMAVAERLYNKGSSSLAFFPSDKNFLNTSPDS